MRDIKFRAWNKNLAKPGSNEFMEYSDKIGLKKFFEIYPKQGVVLNGGAERFIMQSTGLKDKNDKDIYEGDIVIWNDGGGETELNAKNGWIRKAVVKINPDIIFELTHDTPSGKAGHKFKYGSFIYTDTENHLKVIGNIHEGNF